MYEHIRKAGRPKKSDRRKSLGNAALNAIVRTLDAQVQEMAREQSRLRAAVADLDMRQIVMELSDETSPKVDRNGKE